jgi:hypothetical protein
MEDGGGEVLLKPIKKDPISHTKSLHSYLKRRKREKARLRCEKKEGIKLSVKPIGCGR